MKNITFYRLPECGTCQKAQRFLDRHGVEITRFRDIKEEPLSRLEVENLARMLGGAENLFSRRAVKYREMKLGERELSTEEMLDLMTSEYTFLKRPILIVEDRAVAGFFEKTFESFLYD
ncbi:MAG TPA: Spx/MgsR family RNA polymerase-binding regulatory protein [Pyrinomonadaceae bacterium]|nr:Spx/MgsR family RNA polymerase-binding regulatory protein [Pyrinomonadaceae bacterium]